MQASVKGMKMRRSEMMRDSSINCCGEIMITFFSEHKRSEELKFWCRSGGNKQKRSPLYKSYDVFRANGFQGYQVGLYEISHTPHFVMLSRRSDSARGHVKEECVKHFVITIVHYVRLDMAGDMNSLEYYSLDIIHILYSVALNGNVLQMYPGNKIIS